MPITIRRRAETPAPVTSIPGAALPPGVAIVTRQSPRSPTPDRSTPENARAALPEMDGMCLQAVKTTAGGLIAWFLMAAYARHHLDRDLISEACFTGLLRRLQAGERGSHKAAGLISTEMLDAEGWLPAEDYPPSTQVAATWLLRDNRGRGMAA